MRQTFHVPGRALAVIAACILMLMPALLGLPAGALAQSDAKVTGVVLYRERIALPPSARVIVQLQDVSMADAAAMVLDEQTIEPQGKAPPYTFELTYDAAKIDTRFTYAVWAEIKDGDRLLFTTTQRYPVITQGNPVSGIQIVVQSIGSASQPASLAPELLDRDWSLTALQRGPGNVASTTGAGITIRFSADGKVSGSGGCNGFGGTYTVGANRDLTIANLISTLKACAPSINALEQEYFGALQSVSSYTLDSPTRFQLSYGNGQGLLSYVLAAPAPTPTPAPTPSPTPQEQACFAETGKCVGGRFLSYWRQNGGLAAFGYPLSDELTESGRPVQYFERQRFELHAENAAPYDVLLGRLGDELLKRQGIDWFGLPKAAGARAGCRYFPETQHDVCNVAGGPSFLRYWGANGLEFDGRRGKSPAESLALFGLPLTEPMTATLEGKTVLVQWFERARFEWHPENPAAYRVLLGRLGAEVRSTAAPPGNPASPPPPADVTLTNTDNGASVGLKAGQTLAVRLDSNPTTGYSWQVSEVNGAVLRQQGDPQFLRPVDAPLGAGGVLVFRFVAASAGQTRLALVYRRPFEPNAKPADTFSVQVTVQ